MSELMTTGAYIKVENLKYRYPNTTKLALDGLDFEIEKGSFVGIVGENGAGEVLQTKCNFLKNSFFCTGELIERILEYQTYFLTQL